MTAMLPVLLQLVALDAYLKIPSSGTPSLVVQFRKQVEAFTGGKPVSFVIFDATFKPWSNISFKG